MKNKLIGFLGAPGSGKTTIACAMKEYLLDKKISSDVCTEYAREFCFKYGIPKHPYTQYRITNEQINREDLLLKGNNEYIFTDSPVWLGYVYGLVNMKASFDYEIQTSLNDMYEKFVINHIHRYHKVFYLKLDGDPHDDGCRDIPWTREVSRVLDGFVLSHQHMLPIITMNDIKVDETARRKKFVWEHMIEKVEK